MKKRFIGLLIIIILLVAGVIIVPQLIGTLENTPTATSSPRQEIRLNEKITVGEKAFMLTAFEWKEELLVGHKWTPGRGNIFARIKLSFYNEGRKEMQLSIQGRVNYDNGYEVTNLFGENGYNNTNYPISMSLAAGRSYDLEFAAAEVTKYAKDDLDNPLWIEIDFEGEHYIYYVRK